MLFFVSLSAVGQKTVTINDPEISFSYLLPAGFVNDDDDFYHYIFPADKDKITSAALQLTYFEGFQGTISEFKEGVLHGKLGATLDNFKVLDSGVDIIDGSTAVWSSYSFSENGDSKCGMLICFERLEQYFEIQIQGNCKAYYIYRDDLRQVLRSMRVVKN